MKASSPQPRAATSNIDIQVEGKQHGHISLPAPSSTSAYGSVQVPICVIRNGDGPVVTLLAGSRGDEYDGRIALHKLINSMAPEDINGCLIIVPTLNPLAANAQSRVSPNDHKDLDTCFPGNSQGSVTDQLAAQLLNTVLEPADLIIELQSGGTSTQYTPLAAVHFNNESLDKQQKSEQHMIAFGAPYSARLLPAIKGSLAHTANTMDKDYVAVQLGGGATSHAHCIEVAQIGCRNVLVQMNILKQELMLRSTRMLEVTSNKNYMLAPSSGLLEMCKEPGDENCAAIVADEVQR